MSSPRGDKVVLSKDLVLPQFGCDSVCIGYSTNICTKFLAHHIQLVVLDMHHKFLHIFLQFFLFCNCPSWLAFYKILQFLRLYNHQSVNIEIDNTLLNKTRLEIFKEELHRRTLSPEIV